MINFLIKLLGGVTATEFAEVFSLATKDREVMNQQIEFYKNLCHDLTDRSNYLDDLIFKKTGFITPEKSEVTDTSTMAPISGRKSWNSVKQDLIMRDHAEVLKRKSLKVQ